MEFLFLFLFFVVLFFLSHSRWNLTTDFCFFTSKTTTWTTGHISTRGTLFKVVDGRLFTFIHPFEHFIVAFYLLLLLLLLENTKTIPAKMTR